MLALKKYWHWYALGVMALAAYAVWGAVFWAEARRGQVFLRVFDVGQGDALFIEAPGGVQTLIDGGPDSSVLARLGEVMPFWDRTIDLVVLTHPHADHLDGLMRVLERYDVGMVVESGVNHSITEYAAWKSEIARRKIHRVVARRGQVLSLGGGAVLRVLAPFRPFDGVSAKNVHDATVVMRLSFASTSALLMGDAELSLERELIAGAPAGGPIRADVLKVGHHGSKTSTSQALLAAVSPRLAAISSGRQNRYGHPHQEVVDRLAAAGVAVYRTDERGTVTFVSNGRQFSAGER